MLCDGHVNRCMKCLYSVFERRAIVGTCFSLLIVFVAYQVLPLIPVLNSKHLRVDVPLE